MTPPPTLQLRAPTFAAMPHELAEATRSVAETLARAGHRGWLVGGAVRDLALGIEPHDADLATSATPDEVERLFDRTVAVGRAFGTVVVPVLGHEIQVTTFRAERGYSDGRHPDRVTYSETVEEDAQRRDFTCNALYLDPLGDELRDPTGGMDDLRAGRLACVGDPAERFREDGLRLLRLARFAAALGLEVDDGTLAAARAGADRITGVSAERVLGELERIADGPDPARGLELLASIDVLPRVLDGAAGRAVAHDVAAVGRLGERAGASLVLATLLAPIGLADAERGVEVLEGLRAARDRTRAIAEIWDAARRARLLRAGAPRSAKVRIVRSHAWPDAARLLRATTADGDVVARVVALEALRSDAGEQGLHPTPLLSSADLAAAGIAPGPRFGELLREAEDLQLDGRLSDRDAALGWLEERAGE